MENILASLPPRDAETGLVNVIIDTPQGSRNKYKVDEKLGCFRLARVLPVGHAFPYDFGSIPQTRAEDGDALDVLVINDAPSFPGCLVTVRLIGVIAARQTTKGKTIRNDRLIAVPETPVNKARIRDLKALADEVVSGIEQFFISYNRAQGRRFVITGRHGPSKARELLAAGLKEYKKR